MKSFWTYAFAATGLCAAAGVAAAADDESLSKAQDAAGAVVRAVFDCSPEVRSEQSGEVVVRVHKIEPRLDPDFFVIVDHEYYNSWKKTDTQSSKGSDDWIETRARLADLDFEAWDAKQPSLALGCKRGNCLRQRHLSKRADGSTRYSAFESEARSHVVEAVPTCDLQRAGAAAKAYGLLAKAAAGRVPPDVAAWEHVKASRSALDLRRFLTEFPANENAETVRERLRDLERGTSPGDAYDSLLVPASGTYYARAPTSVFAGPGNHFAKAGSLDKDRAVLVTGIASDGSEDDEWLRVREPQGYVKRADLLSAAAREQLRGRKARADRVLGALSSLRQPGLNSMSGFYGFFCDEWPSYPIMILHPEYLALLDHYILKVKNGSATLTHALGDVQEFRLRPSRTVTFADAGAVQLYSVQYTSGKSDFREIGEKNGKLYLLTGMQINFTVLKRCRDKSVLAKAFRYESDHFMQDED